MDSSLNIAVVLFRPKFQVRTARKISLIPNTKRRRRTETMTMLSSRYDLVALLPGDIALMAVTGRVATKRICSVIQLR